MSNKKSTTPTPASLFKQKLKNSLSKTSSPPYLFVGSGISIRFYNVPTWLKLLEEFVIRNESHFKYEFGYYSSKAQQNPIKIADFLAEEFHEKWWTDDQFAKSRVTYKDIAGLNDEIAFKIELCNLIREKISLVDSLKDEYELLSKAVVSGVMTTNWDDFLELILPDFTPRIGQKQLIFSEHNFIGDTYKIHGCISKPESIVLTSSDYKKFESNDHYLKSKILTVFVDFPIIFMGYSLSDPNIKGILQDIITCLDSDFIDIETLHNRLYFVEWQREVCIPKMETSSFSLGGGSIPITKIKLHDFTALFEVLSELPRKFPIPLLKQLQGMVYDFVMTNKPTNKVLVNGLEDLDKIENLEVVVGFGNIAKLNDKGVTGIQDIEIFEDILFETISEENHEELATSLIPRRVNLRVYMPFFKYFKSIGKLNSINELEFETENHVLSRSSSITLEDYQAESQKKYYGKIAQKYNSLEELIEQNDLKHSLGYIPYYKLVKDDVNTLESYLRDNWKHKDQDQTTLSYMRKCICILDFLKYRN